MGSRLTGLIDAEADRLNRDLWRSNYFNPLYARLLTNVTNISRLYRNGDLQVC